VVLPARGYWSDRGQIGRTRLIEFEPNSEATHLAVLVRGEVCDVKDEETYKPVYRLSGSYQSLELGYAEPGAVLRIQAGYKCRTESVVKVEEGGTPQIDLEALARLRERLTPLDEL
jgi:hypothetical protein